MPAKTVIQTDQAIEFMETMGPLSQRKYAAILDLLAEQGFLRAPRAEKVVGQRNLFAFRILTDGNYRHFYCHDTGTIVYVLSGYSKKSNEIPRRELDRALQIRKDLGL